MGGKKSCTALNRNGKNLCRITGGRRWSIVYKYLLNNQPYTLIIQIYSVIKLYGHLLCPSSGVFYCTFGTGEFHAGF
jgi:hypothetical protein